MIEHFISHFNALKGKNIQGISESALDRLMRHGFPGNIRELQNIIEHAFILCHDHLIDFSHLPRGLLDEDLSAAGNALPLSGVNLREQEKNTIRSVLLKHNGHRGKTAQELGIDKSTLWRKMQKYTLS